MPIHKRVDAWLMQRGISAGEPGWYFVPFIEYLALVLMPIILAAAVVRALARLLDPRRWRPVEPL